MQMLMKVCGQYLALYLRRLLGVLRVQSFCHHRVQTAAGRLPPRLLIFCLKITNVGSGFGKTF